MLQYWSPFYRQENWGKEELTNTPEITQVVRAGWGSNPGSLPLILNREAMPLLLRLLHGRKQDKTKWTSNAPQAQCLAHKYMKALFMRIIVTERSTEQK